jgi:hypothetical protein
VGHACIHSRIQENQFITQGQDGLNDVRVTAFNDPSVMASNPTVDIFNAVLKWPSFHATGKSNLIQGEPSGWPSGNDGLGQGALARTRITKKNNVPGIGCQRHTPPPWTASQEFRVSEKPAEGIQPRTLTQLDTFNQLDH